MGIEIERDAEGLPSLQKALVKMLKHGAWGGALFVGPHHNRRAVRVAAAHHHHAVAFEPLKTRKNIAGQIGPRDVPYMLIAIGIGPCQAYKNIFHEFTSDKK